MRRSSIAILLAAVLSVETVVLAPVSEAASVEFPVIAMPPAMGADPVIVQRQDLLSTAAQTVERTAAEVGDEKFTLVATRALDMSLTIYRADSNPAALSATYAAVIPKGYRVNFAPAALSGIDEKNFMTYLLGAADQFESATGFTLSRWGPDGKGGAFVIGYWSNDSSRKFDVQAALKSIGRDTASPVPAQLTEAVNVGSVRFERIAPPATSNGTRGNMTSPFWGGSAIHSGTGGGGNCSSAFPAMSTTPDNNNYYLLTAWHCYSPGNANEYTRWTPVPPGSDKHIGAVSSARAASDIAFIKVGSGYRSTPHVFSGKLGQSDEQTQIQTVIGWQSPSADQIICEAGWALAQVCNLETGVGICWTLTGSNQHVCGSGAHSVDGKAVVEGGQSGGAVYKYSSSGGILAIGVVSARPGSAVTCPVGHRGDGGCTDKVYFGLIMDVIYNNHITVAGWA